MKTNTMRHDYETWINETWLDQIKKFQTSYKNTINTLLLDWVADDYNKKWWETEKALAKEFWLTEEKMEKLSEDYEENNITMVNALATGEEYWKNQQLVNQAADNYEMAA